MFDLFSNLSIQIQLLFVYLVAINIITFVYFVFDKMKAQMKHRRTPEKTLLILALVGGSVGALFSMNFFHHKTKKLSFQAMLAVILALQVIIILTFLQ